VSNVVGRETGTSSGHRDGSFTSHRPEPARVRNLKARSTPCPSRGATQQSQRPDTVPDLADLHPGVGCHHQTASATQPAPADSTVLVARRNGRGVRWHVHPSKSAGASWPPELTRAAVNDEEVSQCDLEALSE